MKRFATFLVAISIILSLVACAAEDSADQSTVVTTVQNLDETTTPVETNTPETAASTEPSASVTVAPTDITEPAETVPATTEAEPAIDSTHPDTQETTPPKTTKPSSNPTVEESTSPVPEATIPETVAQETTAPTETTEPESTKQGYDEVAKNYLGKWYLNGYKDVYINLWEPTQGYTIHVDACNFALPPTSSPVSAYMIYPAKQFMDLAGCDSWGTGFELHNDPSSWSSSLSKHKISFENGCIYLGGYTFVKSAGSKDMYSDTCYKKALGMWYLKDYPNSTLNIYMMQDYGMPFGQYFGIVATEFNFSSLAASGNDFAEGWAGRKNNWDKYGISVSGSTLTVSNSNGTRIFYREPTSATPPTTETVPPVTTEPEAPPTTESAPPVTSEPETPTTEPAPPATESEPPVTTEPATEPATENVISGPVIISNSQTISDTTIEGDVYITSAGAVKFNNVTITGSIYCYGQLTASNCTANKIYAYAYGSMMSCDAFDGTHGIIKGSISCNSMKITDDALDDAFAKWGKY